MDFRQPFHQNTQITTTQYEKRMISMRTDSPGTLYCYQRKWALRGLEDESFHSVVVCLRTRFLCGCMDPISQYGQWGPNAGCFYHSHLSDINPSSCYSKQWASEWNSPTVWNEQPVISDIFTQLFHISLQCHIELVVWKALSGWLSVAACL